MLQIAAPEQTTTYRYGLERLAGVGPTGTEWYLHDGLGSVRLTLDEAGEPVDPSGYSYTPFGVPQSGAIAEPFGFTGEVHSIETGLVYLRARWYDPASGTFLGRDPFEGFPDMPYSQHPYQYGYSNPGRWTDPTGRCYGLLTHLRQIPIEEEWCRNLDKAVLIYTSPNQAIPHEASLEQKAWAYAYGSSWYVGHAILLAEIAVTVQHGVRWIWAAGSQFLQHCGNNPPVTPPQTTPPPAVQNLYGGQVFTRDCVGACLDIGLDPTNPFFHDDFRSSLSRTPLNAHYAIRNPDATWTDRRILQNIGQYSNGDSRGYPGYLQLYEGYDTFNREVYLDLLEELLKTKIP
ncbi:RHS repeat-associated core domain-containing protein [bacterium]|nr:RHS repeat-associated core domain-containing protein [bacterium]